MSRISLLITVLLSMLSVPKALGQAFSDSDRDSLCHLFRVATEDSARLRLASVIAVSDYNVDSVIAYSDLMIEIGTRIDRMDGVALGYSYKSWAYYIKGDYGTASTMAYSGIMFADSVGDRATSAKCYYNLANAYSMLRDAVTANSYYHKALDLFVEAGRENRISDVYRSMGQVDVENQLYEQGVEYLNKANELDSVAGYIYGLSINNWLLSYSHHLRFVGSDRTDFAHLDTARTFAIKGLAYAYDCEDDVAVVSSSTMLADVLLEDITFATDKARRKVLVDSCLALCNRGIERSERCGLGNEGCALKFDLAKLYIAMREMAKAKTLLDSIYAEVMEYEDSQADQETYYEIMSEYYDSKGDASKSLDYFKKFHNIYAKNRQNDYVTQSAQNMAQSHFNQQVKERDRVELQRKIMYEADVNRRNVVIGAACIVLLLVTILAINAIRESRRRRRLNLELDMKNGILEQQKEEMQAQNELLEQQKEAVAAANMQITDSINSARLIQMAALPSAALMSELWGEHFSLLRPKDIVSGDFYWTCSVGSRRILVVADCTGHGVPGALVSMLGMSFLSDIVASLGQEQFSAARILNELRRVLKQALHQSGGEDDDTHGMDLGLVIWEPDDAHLHFAGAFRPIYVFHKGELVTIEGDRMPIGVHPLDYNDFVDHEVEVSAGDMIYLFSDGIVDQFGYDDARGKEVKFSAKRFKSLLADIHGLSCADQKTRILQSIDSWRRVGTAREAEQTDDVLVVGVRF